LNLTNKNFLLSDFWTQIKNNQLKFIFIIFITIILYIIISYLIFISFIFCLFRYSKINFVDKNLFIISIIISSFIIFFQYKFYKNKSIIFIREILNCYKPDINDVLHKQIINIVEELKVATNYNEEIEIIIIPTFSQNIFSCSAGKIKAIGISEGIITKFTREELQAVIAQQFVHIINKDTEIITFICSSYEFIKNLYSKVFLKFPQEKNKNYINKKNQSFNFIIMLPSLLLAQLLLKIMIIFISRNRENYADVKSVEITRNPMALVSALYKINTSRIDKEIFIYSSFSPLFIVPPEINTINEKKGFFADLFSTHPPINERLNNLLIIAGSSLEKFYYAKEKEKYFREKEKINEGKEKEEKNLIKENDYYVYMNNEWFGPYKKSQLFEIENLTPETYINIAGTNIVAEFKNIFPDIFDISSLEQSKRMCPRCGFIGGRLYETYYEFVPVERCNKCKGYLLTKEKIIRIINRNIRTFTLEEIEYAKEYKGKINKMGLKKEITKIDNSKHLICPNCKMLMNRAYYNYEDYIVIDRCTNCNLFWFDNRELEILQLYIEKRIAEKNYSR